MVRSDPDALMREFRAEVGAADYEQAEQTLFAIIDDVLDSVDLALRRAPITDYVRKDIYAAVTDYVANHYGE